jgi:hypothetical protein
MYALRTNLIAWQIKKYRGLVGEGFGAFQQFKCGEGDTLYIRHSNALALELA